MSSTSEVSIGYVHFHCNTVVLKYARFDMQYMCKEYNNNRKKYKKSCLCLYEFVFLLSCVMFITTEQKIHTIDTSIAW